jgi:spermidine synthase
MRKGRLKLQHLFVTEGSDQQRISVYDTDELYGEKGTFRVLQFSEAAVQGAVDLNRPERIVFEYPRAIIHLMEHNDPQFEDVFMIGHGIGTIVSHLPGKPFKTAEFDEQVVELSRRYFHCSTDHVVIGDGRGILTGEAPQSYDYIILDAFTAEGTPRHLTSREFFRLAQDKLDAEGAVIVNLMGRGGHDPSVASVYTTLLEQFAYVKAFLLPSEGAGALRNMILTGSSRPIGYQGRQMAGFVEIEPHRGHVISDSAPYSD